MNWLLITIELPDCLYDFQPISSRVGKTLVDPDKRSKTDSSSPDFMDGVLVKYGDLGISHKYGPYTSRKGST